MIEIFTRKVQIYPDPNIQIKQTQYSEEKELSSKMQHIVQQLVQVQRK